MTKPLAEPERLLSLVPPPPEPVETGPESQREAAEERLGVRLPESLLQLARVYGSGRFRAPKRSGLLHTFNPFAPSFVTQVTDLSQACIALKEAEGDSYIP